MLVKHQSQPTVPCYRNVNMRTGFVAVTSSLRWKLLVLLENWQTSKYIVGSQSVHYKDILINNIFCGFPFSWCFVSVFFSQTLPSSVRFTEHIIAFLNLAVWCEWERRTAVPLVFQHSVLQSCQLRTRKSTAVAAHSRMSPWISLIP
jgi:hypothetical protein